MSDWIIKAESVGKKYRIQHQNRERYTALRDVIARGAGSLFKRTIRTAKPAERNKTLEEFWALKDVSFEIKRGEVVGIIGRNGAGKSTLLKILSRITEPTLGKITLKGRVASLLEVGTGFHPELTGRENIYLNGAILGMSRAEIRSKFDEIVTFAEVEQFLDTPVKRYSSGMYVRLAFAVAAHLEPEILIIDEVLAVGDAQFQQKCLGKMNTVSRSDGRTVLFVSHNMAAVRALCGTSFLLNSGEIVAIGGTPLIAQLYATYTQTSSLVDLAFKSDRKGNGHLRFTKIEIVDHIECPVSTIKSGDHVKFKLSFKTTQHIDEKRLIVAIAILDSFNTIVAAFSTDEMGTKFQPLNTYGAFTLDIPHFLLRGGAYSVRILASKNSTQPDNFYDWIEDAIRIEVLPGDFWNVGSINRAGPYCVIPSTFGLESTHILGKE